MGKKKSVVLLILITIVVAVLCAMIAVPSFSLPFNVDGAKSKWNPVVETFDFGSDLGGEYYTYYYPEGVISEAEYKLECEALKPDADKLNDYRDSYFKIGGLYFSTDPEDGVLEETDSGSYAVTERFQENFSSAVDEIAARYSKKGYSSFRISVVDDYAVKIELPVSDTTAGTALQYFAYSGAFNLYDGSKTVYEDTKDDPVADYIKSFSPTKVADSYYIRIKLTKAGRELIKKITTDIGSSGTLSFKVGDETALSLSVSEAIDEDDLIIGGSNYTYEAAETIAVLFDSVVKNGELGCNFVVDEIRVSEPVYGDNTRTLLYIALAIIVVAALIVPFIRFGGFGGACFYSTLSYIIITAFCFAFVSGGVFEFTLGTVLVFLFGLLVNILVNASVYHAIKAEFDTGRTIEASVKAGFKKTLAGIVDLYVLLALVCVALLIGGAGLYTLALQGLLCVAAGAFTNLLWTRFINCMLVSVSKNKYKYFRFVREDDDDE